MLAQLIPLHGGDPITIVKDVTLVGRQADFCDLVLKRKSVSKIHCVIVKTDGLLFVRDLSSTNGTKVNGQKILRGALLPGDQLSFAGERFRVHLGPAAANGEAPVAAAHRTEEMAAIAADAPNEEFAPPSDSSSDDKHVVDVSKIMELLDNSDGVAPGDDLVE